MLIREDPPSNSLSRQAFSFQWLLPFVFASVRVPKLSYCVVGTCCASSPVFRVKASRKKLPIGRAILHVLTVPQTETGAPVEYTRALERTM